MGIIILFIAVIIETTFAVYCICSKSNQKRTRSIMRISIFAVFIVFTLMSIIKLNFRWKSIAVLLFVWAVFSVLTLIRNKSDKKEYKCRRIIIKTISNVLLIIIALIPIFLFPKYEMIETTGEFKIATDLYTYTDKNRVETYTNTGENRKLNVEFWYPEATDAKYPLIVFSHGSFGIRTSNESLFKELASHGYVVASIDHTFQSLFTTDVKGNKTWINMEYIKEIKAQDAHSHKQQSYEYFQKWMGIRKGDINFVIDYILTEDNNNDADKVYKLVDKGKIGVMGHSLGGSAALGIGRRRDDVSAVMALESPFLDDIEGVDDDGFIFTDEIYPVPVLNVYSDSSWSHLSEWSQYAENYTLLSDTDAIAFNAYIQGVGHLSLTDLALTSPLLTHFLNQKKSETDTEYCLKTINKLTLEFFNCYLKGEGKFHLMDVPGDVEHKE
ncbi:alpha/beta hydrolase family protein [Oceanirhabdus sp. W0125-5]|uniref:alpha/beta hydrolase family protein n=1 Tax=Oceanirhabdus sp. W0125-5 TaxID=2999116 RepID=UPI0022F2F701|nr:acetylhydrolase [Oceanirhabdus sp. W0125-5]WBW94960.1 acetylhydrolase [Oceanirhabdus sp. W0125-5]